MKRWNRGDRHECGLWPKGLHTAGKDCVEYAIDAKDRTFVGNCAVCGASSCTCTVAVPDVDMVNHPPHYTSAPATCAGCGKSIECIDITRHMSFNVGNVIKYLWRAGLKGDAVEQLKKAAWYLADEIALQERAS